MSNDSKQINASLRQVRDLIHALPLGRDRDALQARFDLVLDRIEQVPARVMAQFGTVVDGAELAEVWGAEMLRAIEPLDIEP
jgi:hypothetical protein